MKKIRAISLGLLGLFGSANGLAAQAWSQLVPVGSVESDSSSVPGGSLTYIGVLPGITGAPTACQITGAHNQALVDSTSPDHVKQVTSIAMAALLSGKLVQLHFTGSCGGQSNIYPIVDSIVINN